jgi:hypothetical protein
VDGERYVTGAAEASGTAAKALDGFGASGFSQLQCLLGLAQNHHRGAALAGGDAKACGEPDGVAADTVRAERTRRAEAAQQASRH